MSENELFIFFRDVGVAWALHKAVKVDVALSEVKQITGKVLKEDQTRAITASIIDRRDVIVILPTGYGKSLIYQSLPIVYTCLGRTLPPMAVLDMS